ncbi:thymidine kinase 2, mitochondrial-like [Tubulanus polymorphus]|uniref:thymidine kinase 2, mitochondrial-like n=1 Tax=Tubulanus polymorphus TaxID=672921 RepID=UPI003DA620F9
MLGLWHTEKQVTDIDCLTLLKNLKSPRQSKFTVSVEGNIGCGKSTLIEFFDNSPVVEAIKEPVEKWCNLRGHNALELLYQDPVRWSFSFNNYAQLTRLQMHRTKTKKAVKMLERSLYSTRYCFVENSYRDGIITELEYAVLSDWFSFIIDIEDVKVDLFVYLKADPEICYDRIQKRARKEETGDSGVPFELIEKLHDLHEKWLIEQTVAKLPAPVLVLDANRNLPQMKDVYELHRREILCGYA